MIMTLAVHGIAWFAAAMVCIIAVADYRAVRR